MLPNLNLLTTYIDEDVYPTRTYRVRLLGNENSTSPVYLNKVSGYTDGIDALKQTIYFILGTERYEYLIYSWDYGIELQDLFGKPMPYVIAEIKRRITEALTMDDRITDVVDFQFERNREVLHVTFSVVSTLGTVPTELEVDI
jgi:hypothetical protein